MSLSRLGVLAGAFAPFAFLAGLGVASRTQGDYMTSVGWHVWPHGLSLGPHGWLWAASAVALGVLLLAFAAAVWAEARLPAGFFAVAGIGALFMAGKTELNPVGSTVETANPVTADTWEARLSGSGFWLLLLALVAACVILWLRIRREASWRGTRRFSLLALALLLPAFALPTVDALDGYVFLVVVFAPLVVLSVRLFAVSAR